MDLLTMLVQVTLVAAMAALISAQAKPDCQGKCGSISIPYPFGTEAGCYHDPEFLVTCNKTYNPPKLFYSNTSNINVTNISVDGQLYILHYIASNCYDQSGSRTVSNIPSIRLSKFRISSTRNKFTAVGCATRASIVGVKEDRTYGSGCMTICDSLDYVTNGSCSGIGCCQTSIPTGVAQYRVVLDSYFNHSFVWNFSKCSYAFVVEEDKFNFSSNNLSSLQKVEKLPVVLDWAIGNVSCSVAKESPGYACKGNTSCYEVDFGQGYRCNCSEGYRGNPYLTDGDGCQDIDECNDEQTPYPCEENKNFCKNRVGNYTCSCPKGYHGDGRKNGTGCIADRLLVIKIGVGSVIGILVLSVASSSLVWVIRRRRLIQQKAKNFEQNGGTMLQEKLSLLDPSVEAAKIFTIEVLQKATNNFNKKNFVGEGGFGKVYKGVLPQNNMAVAIKRSVVVDQSKFTDEVVALSQINQTNVVKLLGCCLEVEVPLLVYEFITNGTLFHHIHEVPGLSISWEIRLRIAKETAEALSYLHSKGIIHGDVKSTNILLHDGFTAKVSDFGASRIGPSNEKQLQTMIQGTLGYLDPEYHQTSQLSKKSDIYSFGVVLVELLTGRIAICSDKPEKERILSNYFISSMNKNRLILDHRIGKEDDDEQVGEVATLALHCLKLKGDERPAMSEVATKLEELMRKGKNLLTSPEVNPTEPELLPGKSLDGSSTSSTVGYDSPSNQAKVPL
ncbi:wall-associated receptor kinase 2-like [Cornus florida]|uniref:wall-associated receptor kinase 2-like n=1 Tax=Cornus florida TaxID=4283 RepID=UPI00289E5AD4|nr:wall-associated receptor kinase 2-like [Cornus florida]